MVAAALAVSIKAGAVREGESSEVFARQAGLANAGVDAAWRQAARRAQAGGPDMLVPSAAALDRMASALDLVAPGLGIRWRARLSEICVKGMTPMAEWLRSIPGALTSEQAPPQGMSANVEATPLEGRPAKTFEEAPVIIDSSLPAPVGEEGFSLFEGELEEFLELTFDDIGEVAVVDSSEIASGELTDEAVDTDDLLLSDETIDDLLSDDSVDLDDDWCDDQPPGT